MTIVALCSCCRTPPRSRRRSRGRSAPQKPMEEIQDFIEPRVPAFPEVQSAAECARSTAISPPPRARRRLFRGEAKRGASRLRLEWRRHPGGPGTRSAAPLRSSPGLWIPALLYVPKNSPQGPRPLAVTATTARARRDYSRSAASTCQTRVICQRRMARHGPVKGPG